MLWAIYSNKNEGSADQYHVTLSLAQVKLIRIQMFFTAFVSCSSRLFKLETEGQTIRNSPQNITNPIKILAYKRAVNNPTQKLQFYAKLNLK